MTFENYTMYSIKTPQTNMCLYLWEISKLHTDGNVTRDILSKTWGYDTTHCQRKQQSGYVYSKTSAQYLMTTTQMKKRSSHSTACDFVALLRGMFVHALKTLHEQDNDL